jgi:glyoxylase-like metal-dependent hydrolase (beta-lactamase superfamily II)/rhodanese-related sulfurtransferase
VILRQYYLGCLSHASYLIGDESTQTAVVVDPQRDVDQYLADARAAGLTIRHVLLTHFHADFVSGHLELQAATGATIHLGRSGTADFEYRPVADGDVLALGRVRLAFLETPGHTPESVSILVYDLDADAGRPHAVLTGDTLFVGDVGRPDLMASSGVTAEELAGMLYDSLWNKLLCLPDETLVYPAHGGGSLCGKSLSSETVSTIGVQRATNLSLQVTERDEFIRRSCADLPPVPAYFQHAADYNRQERDTLATVLARSLEALSVADVLAAQAEGAQVLDVRTPDAFARGHLKGSINVGLSGRYASWAGTVLDMNRPILLVADPGQEAEAAMRLGRIGYDHVRGYLRGGPAALGPHPALIARVDRLDPEALRRELASDHPPVLVDVRTDGEREAHCIPGSLHVPLGDLAARWREIPTGRRVVIHCAGGYRSMVAASLLAPHGYDELADLEGGLSAWLAAGLPTSDSVPA